MTSRADLVLAQRNRKRGCDFRLEHRVEDELLARRQHEIGVLVREHPDVLDIF